MEQKSKSSLMLDFLPRRAASAIRANRLPFLTAVLWGMLAYGFAFTNKLVNHDEVSQLFGKGATVSSGRWGLGVLDAIFPNYSMPWGYGIVTIVLIALGICFILRMFRIENHVLQVLLSGCMMVFPSVIGVFGYMFTSSSYGLSYLLCVLAVWLLTRKERLDLALAFGCMVASLSIYQSYISIAASLLVVLLIRELLTGAEPATVLKQGIGYVLFLIFSLALYYGATQVILKWKGVSFNDYASDSITLSVSGIVNGIGLAYGNFFRFFFEGLNCLMPTGLSRSLHWGLLAGILLVTLILVASRKQQRLARYALLTLLVALLPLAINCMYLVTAESSIHTLVLYSFTSTYVFAAMVLELALPCISLKKLPDLLRRLALELMPMLLAAIVVINVYVANESYLNMHLRYENAYAFYTMLTTNIQQMPEFTEGTRVAVIGSWQSPEYYTERFAFTDALTGVKGFLPSDYSYPYFLEYYLGFPVECVTTEEAEAIRHTKAFQNMPTYPYHGSIAVIDDVIVVKLSEA